MRFCVLTSTFLLLASSVHGQWSAPVWLDTDATAAVSAPVLMPGLADTIWAVWGKAHAPSPSQLWAGKVVGDSLVSRELVHQDAERVIYPFDGLAEPSGSLRVVYYAGLYETNRDDPWNCAVLSSERSASGWAAPETVFTVTLLPGLDTIPFHINLGIGRRDSVAIVWEQEMGTMGANSWLDYMHLRNGEWTGRTCLAPMSPPDTLYSGGSLIPGRNSDFLLAFARPQPGVACSVEVWSLTDTLVSRQTSFSGSSPSLAQSGPRDFLTFVRHDSAYTSVRDSSGWQPPVPIPTQHSILHPPRLYADQFGVVWACWAEEAPQDKVILASYNAGNSWSIPETVALAAGCWGAGPEISSGADGRIWVAWFEDLLASYGLRVSHRIARPAISERGQSRLDAIPAGPSIVRGVLDLAVDSRHRTAFRAELLDAIGRRVAELHPGLNDVSGLAPGVYFVREEYRTPCLKRQSVRKVAIQH